ncbi:MAG: T9SS type A sorting domain-containing protein [Candidatus Kapabacteria bacterium]|nr:T9SS type A sorting domain-containing protein [Ignavibacteriota bacterium]MCW5885586.1 T9SS type A sorting domain-containing protein [Candidatus Kapabacteria bacterium]
MRKLFLILFFLQIIALHHHTKANPNIVWEKELELNNMTGVWIYKLGIFDNELYIWLAGSNQNEPTLKAINNIKTDIFGNVIYNKKADQMKGRNGGNSFIYYFYRNNNYMEFRGIWNWAPGGLSNYHSIKIQSDGEMENFHSDSSNKMIFYDPAYANSFYDSVYVGFFHAYKEENKQKLLVLNDDGEYIRDLQLDTAGINEPIHWDKQQYYLFPSSDKHIITTLYSPIDTKQDHYGWNDFVYICKFNLDGNLIWNSKLHNEGYKRLNIYYIRENTDSSFFIIGEVFNTLSDKALYFAKVNKDGIKLWSKTVNHADPITRIEQSFTPLRNGEFYAIYGRIPARTKENEEGSDFYMMIIDSSGKVVEEYSWNRFTNINAVKGVVENEDGNIIVLGRNGWDSYYLAEIKPDFLTNVANESASREFRIGLYPNPASDYVRIKTINYDSYMTALCSLVDINGKEVQKFNFTDEYDLSTKNLNSGNYILRINFINEFGLSSGTVTENILIIK